MFMRMDKKTVASDLGFTVHRDDAFTLSYREGDHVLKFELELSGVKEYGFLIYSDSSLSRRWQPPFDQEEVSPEKKREIMERVLAAVKFMGGKNPLVM
jgi:hypothetical protein